MTKYELTKWNSYIEIPRRSNSPTHIDEILQKRMNDFLRARKLRSMQ